MTETEEKKNLAEGEEGEDEYTEEEVEEEEEGNEEDAEKEDEGEEETAAPVKQRRCQRRKKVRQIILDHDEDEDEDEGFELFFTGEDEEDEEGEDEGSEAASYTSSVLSAISFVWEDEVYEFEELCDPGNIEKIYRKSYVQPNLLDDVGVFRYLEVCRSLSISPTLRVLESLGKNEIDLSHRNIHSSGIRAMCAALETNNIVERLILRFNKLKLEDCYYIGLILHYNERLSYLDFTGCRVGPEGLELLVAYLDRNECVVDLNLSKCNIRDEGMKLLAHVLVRNNSIQKLDLSYNKLGEESGESLALAIKMNSSVTHLVLRYNNLFDPATMKGFFRSLTFNTSISYLDLSWNGMSGEEIGGYIKNYLRRSSSIQYLDLSDNRFEGMAVIEIKKGLAKSRTLETLKMGRNPMSPEDLDAILSGAMGSYNLKILDLDDLWVKKSFMKNLKKIQLQREIEVNYAGMFGNYEVFGPDYPKVILERAQFEAQKPKNAKKRKDFGHLMWTLGDEPLTQDDFMALVKKFKAKISKELFPELMKQFLIPKVNLIDVVAMRQKYLSLFPDSTPPPPPKVKGKKGQMAAEQVAAQQEEVKEKPAGPAADTQGKKPEGPGVEEGDEGGEEDEGVEYEELEGEFMIGDGEEIEEELGVDETAADTAVEEEREEEEAEAEDDEGNVNDAEDT